MGTWGRERLEQPGRGLDLVEMRRGQPGRVNKKKGCPDLGEVSPRDNDDGISEADGISSIAFVQSINQSRPPSITEQSREVGCLPRPG